ncbi:peptidoglycan amidohydrolase family protein, partial [Lactiplantibacillus plantarum]
SDAKGSHQYLKQISENDAKAGDIVIVNQGAGAGNNGHTAILLGKWQGKATKIIEQGGVGDKVNESTFGTAFYSLLSGSDVTLARPIKK